MTDTPRVNPIECPKCRSVFEPDPPPHHGVHAIHCPKGDCREEQRVRFKPLNDTGSGVPRVVAWFAEHA